MLQKLQKHKESGFTIVEVLIVLAIAALILLIVFLAVPALQRNARNTGRKEDAGRLASAYTNWVSNNSGNVPVAANAAADLTNICTDAGALSQYTDACKTVAALPAADTVNNAFGATAGLWLAGNEPTNAGQAFAGGQTAKADVGIFDEGYVCDTATNALPGSLSGGTATDTAFLYTLETGSGQWNWTCVDAN